MVLRNQKKLYRAQYLPVPESYTSAIKKRKTDLEEHKPQHQEFEEHGSTIYYEEQDYDEHVERLQSEDEQEMLEEAFKELEEPSEAKRKSQSRHGVNSSTVGLENGRRRSRVWHHFTVDQENRAAFCKVCNHKLSYNSNSTSNLLNHLKLVHSVSDQDLGLAELPKRNPLAGSSGHKRTSVVWNSFKVNKETGNAVCTICSASFKHNARSTSNLLTHIRSRHTELLQDGSGGDEVYEEPVTQSVVKFTDPLQTRPKKKTSKVWDSFVVNEETNKATCRMCFKDLTYSRLTTSNLLKHLSNYCLKTNRAAEPTEDSDITENLKVEIDEKQ